jgi:hypothetical protein
MSGKYLKDFRRRSVETALVFVGASERTVDDDLEILHQLFESLINSMNTCSAVLNQSLDSHKSDLFKRAEFSKAVSKIYSTHLGSQVNNQWPDSLCTLQSSVLSIKYDECCRTARNIIGASCDSICAEQGLEPFRTAAAIMQPEIEETWRIRSKLVIDFDSYRRRLKTLETKKTSVEATAKEKVLLELNTEIARYTAKVSSAEQAYTESNKKTKEDIIASRVSHDELLDSLLVTSIICQAELHARIGKELEQLLQLCPSQQVADVRKKIEDLIKIGGPSLVVTKDNRFFGKVSEKQKSGSIPLTTDSVSPAKDPIHLATDSMSFAKDAIVSLITPAKNPVVPLVTDPLVTDPLVTDPVSHATDSVPLARDPVTLAKDAMAFAKEAASHAKDPTSLAKNPTDLTSEATSLDTEAIALAKDTTPLTKDSVPLAKEALALAKDSTTLAEDPTWKEKAPLKEPISPYSLFIKSMTISQST